jgi:hypothetical protein
VHRAKSGPSSNVARESPMNARENATVRTRLLGARTDEANGRGSGSRKSIESPRSPAPRGVFSNVPNGVTRFAVAHVQRRIS